ncbi:hypothetical protein Q1695_003953 [Nippostrongylus brasiliensis]|nr:hypothetical protein Q1695_003953 [Nippostrongylus brasiliensis]
MRIFHCSAPPSPLLIHSNLADFTTEILPPSPPPPDCSTVKCPAGTRCRMVTEKCDSAPCSPPVPECVANDTSTLAPPAEEVTTLAASVNDDGPHPPAPPPVNCSDVRCPEGRKCEMIGAESPTASTAPRLQPTPPSISVATPAPPPSTTPARTTTRPPTTVPPPTTLATTKQPSRATRPRTIATTVPSTTPRTAPATNRFPTTAASPPPAARPLKAELCPAGRCPSGSSCRVVNGREECFAQKSHSSGRSGSTGLCAGVKCPVGTICKEVLVQSSMKPLCFRVPPPNLRCPPNESWRNCPSLCEPTCKDKTPQCQRGCGKPGICQCDPGFVRDQEGFCKPPGEC